jgi:hypothetical protein
VLRQRKWLTRRGSKKELFLKFLGQTEEDVNWVYVDWIKETYPHFKDKVLQWVGECNDSLKWEERRDAPIEWVKIKGKT